MRNILVPTDFSNNAYDALFFATRFLKNEKCTFFLLHTFDVKTPVLTSRINPEKGKLKYEEQKASVEFKLKDLKHSIVRDTEGFTHNFETISISNPLIETVHKTIRNNKIDLVVMGTKGASGLKEFFLGSNSVKVLESLYTTPILLVPNEVNKIEVNQIGFANSFNKKISDQSITELNNLCNLNNSSLKVIHVSSQEIISEEQEKNREAFEGEIKGLEYSNVFVSKLNLVENHLIEILTQYELDMLIMIKYKHDDYYKLMNEPIIKKLGYHVKTPMLVIPN